MYLGHFCLTVLPTTNVHIFVLPGPTYEGPLPTFICTQEISHYARISSLFEDINVVGRGVADLEEE